MILDGDDQARDEKGQWAAKGGIGDHRKSAGTHYEVTSKGGKDPYVVHVRAKSEAHAKERVAKHLGPEGRSMSFSVKKHNDATGTVCDAVVTRYDLGALRKPVKDPVTGYMRADAYLTRTGIFTYRNADGTERRELRVPEEVFSPTALSSFSLVPLTNEHPPEGFLDATNTQKYQVGVVEKPVRDEDKMRSSLIITDASTIAALEAGKTQLSGGYQCEVEETPGVTADGQRYDGIQRNIRGNHVALVSQGRAGPEVAVRVDSVVHFFKEQHTMIKIRIDGVEFEMSESAASAVAKLQAKADTDAANAAKVLAQTQARADSAEAEVAKLKATVSEAPAKIRAEIQARVALEGQAREILGAEAKLDTLSDIEVKRTAVAKATPALKLDGKSDAYVEAAFELALAEFAKEGNALAAARAGVSPEVRADGPLSADAAREKFYAASRVAHIAPK